ncbi:hypothetical protein O9993_07375 [Vibrio lentus]|nr:hypothetical protein [Vibrio lentus]
MGKAEIDGYKFQVDADIGYKFELDGFSLKPYGVLGLARQSKAKITQLASLITSGSNHTTIPACYWFRWSSRNSDNTFTLTCALNSRATMT